jgi:hypothetical protein
MSERDSAAVAALASRTSTVRRGIHGRLKGTAADAVRVEPVVNAVHAQSEPAACLEPFIALAQIDVLHAHQARHPL